MKRVAFLNGQYVPEEEASIPVWDFGFTMGVTLTEQLRTFDGELRFLHQHLARLAAGLAAIGLNRDRVVDEVSEVASTLLGRNQAEEPEIPEWGVGICVTPGSSRVPSEVRVPTRLVYCYPLNAAKIESMYREGVELSTVHVAEVDEATVPKTIKHRSRIHYWLADREAEQIMPDSRPLLLDSSGLVAESSIASIVAVNGSLILSPRSGQVLESTSLQSLRPVLEQAGFVFETADLTIERLQESDEVWWVNATSLIVPVTQIDRVPIGDGGPGPGFFRAKSVWQREWLGVADS